MKKIVTRKNILLTSLVLFIALILLINFYPKSDNMTSESIAVKKINSQILGDGIVESRNTAILHFQVGGKLAYLPLKEGDRVYKGQTIAQLDTYVLQRQLTIALNNYRSTRDSFDQTKDNQENGIAVGQQRYAIEKTTLSGLTNPGEIDIINDILKRIVDQSQATLDNSVANVELANYSLQLSSLTSPIDGVITRLDVKNPNINITPSTSFVISDPNDLVFNANISEAMIGYVDIGSRAEINITNGDKILGSVTKIYPQKTVLSNGENVYKVEITSDKLIELSKMGQSGLVRIETSLSKDAIIVPSWTVLGKKNIWINDNGNIVLKNVQVGKIIGEETEIISGLKSTDKIILNPKSVIEKEYKIL